MIISSILEITTPRQVGTRNDNQSIVAKLSVNPPKAEDVAIYIDQQKEGLHIGTILLIFFTRESYIIIS